MNVKYFAVALLSTSALAGTAWAQETQDQPAAGAATTANAGTAASDNGDIVVTAQKRSERLRDVPLSITAASGEQLARQTIWSALFRASPIRRAALACRSSRSAASAFMIPSSAFRPRLLSM